MGKQFRPYEWVVVAYFSYTSLLALLLPIRPDIARTTILVNLAVLAGQFLLVWADGLRRRPFFDVLRDWYCFPLMLLAYREMGWFARPHTDFVLERSWVVFDRILLNDLGLRTLIESFGPVFPAILEIAYTLVYGIASFSVAMLYVFNRRKGVQEFLFVFLTGIFAAYALFPFFPSEPPRTVFPGEDFPRIETIFRNFNWVLLGGYGIHTSVFPSAHVSGSFSAAFAMWRLLRRPQWVPIVLLILAILIAIATVYGRYHYAVDAAAGLAVAAAASRFGRMIQPASRRPATAGTTA